MNYLKTSIKFIKRNKFFSGINILGLSVALAVSFVMLLHLVNEFSFDSVHKNRNKVYRVVNYYKDFGHKMSGTPFPLAEDLKASFPQIEKATNTRYIRRFAIKVNDNWIKTRTLATDSDIFDIFTLPLLSQNIATEKLLQSPDNIVISEKMANIIFKQENPIGKQITAFLDGKEQQYNVVGIYENIPENSSLQADCFINSKWGLADILKTVRNADVNYEVDLWRTWVKLSDKQALIPIKNQLNDFLKTHNVNTEQRAYSFQNLNDMHLYSADINNSGKVGDLYSLKIISVIVLLILIVASFNYVTLSTAISTNRAKEIGVRKTNGAGTAVIQTQLLSESVLMALIALPIAVLLMYLIMPYAEQLFEIRLSLIRNNLILYASFFVALTVLIGLLSGLYSSYYLSKLKTIDILNKKPFIGRKKHTLRNSLIVFQLVVFCVFVTSAFIVQSQYKYAINKDLGYNTSNILFVNLDEDEDYHLFLNQVQKMSPVVSVGCAMDPLPTLDASSFMVQHFTDKDKKVQVEGLDVDYNYGNKTIIGVTKDFILHSIHTKVPPLYIVLENKYIFQMAIRYQEGQLANLLPLLQTEWSKIYQDMPMQYFTSADLNEEIYFGEQNFFKMITIGGLFTLFIAMLGLLGITLFITKSRTKEIGIRKVVGSSVKSVVLMLLKGTIYKVIIASVIAVPITYLLMQEWLNHYAYSVGINLWYFVLSLFIALVVVMLTVIGQAYRAASRNPVEALRYE